MWVLLQKKKSNNNFSVKEVQETMDYRVGNEQDLIFENLVYCD
jgi:hypothetical protein